MLAFELKISGIDALKAMAANVRRYPEEAAIAGRDAANSIAKFALVEAANDMSQRYNLQPTYVKELMSFTPAEAGGRAVVSVRNRAIRLARFESRQITVAARLAKGDKLRKIAPGRCSPPPKGSCPATPTGPPSSGGACAISSSTSTSLPVSRARCRRPRCGPSMMPAITCWKTSTRCWCRRSAPSSMRIHLTDIKRQPA